jgi:RNA polymerase sigma factor (TIGR02999 family)
MANTAACQQITALLAELGTGKRAALDRLMPLVYGELRRIARRQLMRERPGHTLDSVALVNEAFLQMVDQDGLTPDSRAHFFGISGGIMRRILVDYARARNADKRGGGMPALVLDDLPLAQPLVDVDRLLALDAALEALGRLDHQAVALVEQRYFAGATEEEAARALGISPATARRRWAFAKACLQQELEEGGDP